MIELAGARLDCAWWGPSQAPSLVLLHEGLGSVQLWRDFPQRLADATGCRVFAWSRPGYGRSSTTPLPRPLDYLEREARDGVRPVLDAAGIGRCILLGHSDGASIAALYGGRADDRRVAGLVLIAPHYFVEDVSIAAIEAARLAYEAGDLRARLARWHDDVDTAFHGWNGMWLDPGFRGWNILAALAGIDVPVLQVQGSADPYGTRAHADALRTRAAVETLLVPARHNPHAEAAEPVMVGIAGFVRRVFGDTPAL